jgi:hypothetical protein
MYSFLVLGIIPGTNLTISFQAWLIAMAVILFAVLAFRLRHRGRLDTQVFAWGRTLLHANQLHQRLQ